MNRPARPFVIGHSSLVIPRRQRRGGFALLITITLLAFLVLLLVSLSSLTRVETQVASNSQSLVQARQNALMALNIAIGQLQKTTGPDQSVTAPADLPLPASITITPPTYDFGTSTSGGSFTNPGTTGAQAIAAINSYWEDPANPRNRHWTGVWKNGNTAAFDLNNPSAFNARPALQDWLVSGNENSATGDTYKPTDPITGLTLAVVTAPGAAANDQIKNAAGNPYRLLVGANTAGIVSASDMDRAVAAPQVSITATSVPGTNGAATSVGHYAWWVGDEGIKARANLVDPYAAAVTGESPSDATDRTLHRLQSAQRLAIEAMTTTGTDGLATTFPVNTTEISKVISPTQLPYLNSDTTFPTELKSRYYDLSVSSRGVLADVRHGGLKRDFTYLFARTSIADFHTALNTPDFNVAPLSGSNIALSPAATPYANQPSILTANPLDCSATWEQLWSHANLGATVTNGVAPSRPATATQQGLFPILVQAKLFYSLRVQPDTSITIYITPVVVLANPYNVTLSGNFTIGVGAPTPQAYSGKLKDPLSPPLAYTTNPNGSHLPGDPGYIKNVFTPITDITLSNGGLQNVQLVAQATGIPPGVAQIFTIDPAANLKITGQNDKHTIAMINTYDPSVFLTYNTGLAIKAGDTHAALYATAMSVQLYMGNTTIPTNQVANVGTKAPGGTGAPVNFGFVVYPVATGAYGRGGGLFFALEDAQANPQQSTFYQINYRALRVDYIGNSSYSDHPLQWGNSYGVIGQAGDSDPSFNPMLTANLLPPPGEAIPSTTRWGLINSGAYPALTTIPAGISDPQTSLNTRLYDIPTPGHPLTSLGQLQHFNLSGFTPVTGGNSVSNSFQVNYPIANSYPEPRVKRDSVFYCSKPFGNHYDGSYLWNDILWDRFYFSSFPQTGPFDFSKTDAADTLINARYKPFRSSALVPYDDPTQFRGLYSAAKNLLADGAFNVNSTSVEAWKALFSSLKSIPVGTDTAPSAPFPRTLTPSGGSASSTNGISANAWNGYRDLTQTEINSLAQEMVLQVRLRGPFLSLADFVNRRLIAGPTTNSNSGLADPYCLGLSGALQSAIDRAVNQRSNVPAPYNTTTNCKGTSGTLDGTGVFKGLDFADLQYRMQTHIAGYPGYLLQGDVLSAIASTLSARSDTFTIRTYGDTTNPVTGAITGRAWCEAVVQRTPDYVVPQASGGNAPDETPVAGSTNATYGRRYEIVSFRWLSPSDI